MVMVFGLEIGTEPYILEERYIIHFTTKSRTAKLMLELSNHKFCMQICNNFLQIYTF